MYLTGPQSQVFAVDARNGQEKWKYTPNIDVLGLPLCCGQVNRGVAVGDGHVFVGQVDAKLTALNQDTGEVAWSVQVDDPRAGYSETMAPVYYDGLVYIGVSGAEYEIRGHVTAYDAKTGDQVWRFYTIPEPGRVRQRHLAPRQRDVEVRRRLDVAGAGHRSRSGHALHPSR